MSGHNMQVELDALAEKLRASIALRDSGNADWVAGTHASCSLIAEARGKFTADIDFGKWFDGAGIKMNPADRAAAIAMGADPERALQVLAATQRRSLRLIYEKEFRVCSVAKPTARATKSPQPQSVEKRERASAAYDRLKEAGEPVTYAALAEEAQVSSTVVRVVLAAREAEEQVKAEVAEDAARAESLRPLAEEMYAQIAKMTAPERKKWDAHVAKVRGEIQGVISRGIANGIERWKAESGYALFEKRVEEVERAFTAWPHSVMRKEEYQTLLFCLHPDTAAARDPEQITKAFRILTKYKLKMINDEEERVEARRALRSSMPQTLAEMDARRKVRR